MKVSTKVALASAAGLILAGAVMCAIGFGMGGWAAALEITDNSPYMDLRNGLAVGYDSLGNMSKEGDYTLSFKSEYISNLDFEVGASDVKIVDNTTDNNINVTIKNASYASDDTSRSLQLRIKGNVNGKSDVTIAIPKGKDFDSVKLEMGATDMEIDSLICSNLKVSAGAGDVTIGDLLSSNYTELKVAAGSLTIKNAKLKDLNLECGAGDVHFTGVIEDDLDAECGMGNITLELIDKSENHQLDLEAAMGNITFNGESKSGFVNEIEEGSEMESEYEIECGMGNIDITFTED
jgi:DUF4097 and DUF4098 domain-containing protein YvlB